MILDTHDNLARYAGIFRDVNPQPLFDWLKACRDIPAGQKIDFAGDKLFAKTLRQDTGGRDAFKWETHREYIDLQYIIGGAEIIEWAPAAKLVPDGAYDAATDFQFYAPAAPDESLVMADGLFVFLFPQDGHKPLVGHGADPYVQKVIVKIHRSLLAI